MLDYAGNSPWKSDIALSRGLSQPPEPSARRWRVSDVDLPTQFDKIASHVDAFQHLCNHHRPRGALDGLTPNEHLQICRDRMNPPSHIS